jgi:drug/metabolite transporter (DMT)-like permease
LLKHSDTDQARETDSPLRGYLFAGGSAVASALTTVLGKWNLRAISPLLLNCLIFSIATVVLTAFVLFCSDRKRIVRHSRAGWLWLGMFSLSSVFALWFFWAGVQQMDPSLAAFLNRTEVLLAILFGVVLLRERFTKAEALGAAISIAGIVVMRITLRMEYSLGFWYVLIGAVLFALAELFSKLAVRFVEPFIVTYLRSFFVAVVFWIALLGKGANFDGLEKVWLGVLALGIVGPIAARMTYLVALKHLDLSKVAVIGQTQPVFVLLLAFLALGQLPTVRETIGGLLLLVGCFVMVIARYHPHRQQRSR